jgi:hypothetical protein
MTVKRSFGVTTVAESAARKTETAEVGDVFAGGFTVGTGAASAGVGAAGELAAVPGSDAVTARVLSARALSIRALSAACGAARRDDGKSRGVMTMTSAIKTTAIMVRLSMQLNEVAREPDRNHRDGTDDSARFVVRPTTSHEARRASRALQWRTRNSLDNSGTKTEAAVIAPPGTRAPSVRAQYASRLHARPVGSELRRHGYDIVVQCRELDRIRFAPRPNCDVRRRSIAELRQEFDSNQFTKPTLELVSIDR